MRESRLLPCRVHTHLGSSLLGLSGTRGRARSYHRYNVHSEKLQSPKRQCHAPAWAATETFNRHDTLGMMVSFSDRLVAKTVRTFLYLALAVATPSAFGTTYPMNQVSPAGAGTNPSAQAGWNRGYRFTVTNPGGITVTQLGMAVPAAGSGVVHNLKLWDFTSQQLLASATITSDGSETWQWANLGSPVTLSQGQDYIVTVSAAQTWAYFFSTNPQYQPAGAVQYVQMRYSNTTDTFPTIVLTGHNYGFVDIGYASGPVGTPIGNGALLTLTGLLVLSGMWMAQRRRVI